MIYFVKGAIETILNKCTHYYNDGATTPLYDKQRTEYTTEAFKMGSQGLRGTCTILSYFLHLLSMSLLILLSMSMLAFTIEFLKLLLNNGYILILIDFNFIMQILGIYPD